MSGSTADAGRTEPPVGPHDAPSVAQIVEAVREWLERDVMTSTQGRLRFHARVAANMLGIVERELEVGPEQARRHAERLAALGVTDDAELAARIRADDLDDVPAETLRDLLRDSVEDKLRVANPRYLD